MSDEETFNCLEVGKRPDTVVVRNVPGRWVGIDVMSTATVLSPTKQLTDFFAKFGPVQ